jgi:hypothetical protein
MILRMLPTLIAILAVATSANAQILTRGPYLQMMSSNAVTVRWQTDLPCESRVQYGLRMTLLDRMAKNVQLSTEHEIRLTDLKPATLYYYAVGTSSAKFAGGDEACRFKTAPVAGSDAPVRVWVLGDSGTGTGGKGVGSAEKVQNGYGKSSHYKDPDVWLMLGDNAYEHGTEQEMDRAIFRTYRAMLSKAVLWSTLGNHDEATRRGEPYFNAFSFPTAGECGGKPSGTENYYSFDHGNIHFISLDSQVGKNREANGPMFTWLEADLSSTQQKWIIAFFHHPPYTKGSHDSDTERAHIEMRERALPILEAHGVDLVLGGHSHCYERSMLIDGHYGLSTTFDPAIMAKDKGNGRETGDGATGVYNKKSGDHNGTVYIVGGNSGKVSGGRLNHPVMTVSKSLLGSLAIDVQADRMDILEIGVDGEAFDQFSILKNDR